MSEELTVLPLISIQSQSDYLTVMQALVHMHKSALVLGSFVAAAAVETVYSDLYEQGRANGWLRPDGTTPESHLVPELTSTQAPREPGVIIL